MLSPVAFVVVSSCTVLLYSVLLAVNRLLLHPLASFPGPKIAALTKWYEFYFDVLKRHGGQYAFEIKRLHEIYGKQNGEGVGKDQFISRVDQDQSYGSIPKKSI